MTQAFVDQDVLVPAAETRYFAGLSRTDPIRRNRWRAAYPALQALITTAVEAELREAWAAYGIGPGTRVLDAGCGPGVSSILLAGTGADVVGLDADDDMIGYARNLPEPAGTCRFVTADLRARLPLPDGGMDVVWLGNVWVPGAGRELARVLVEGGRLLFARLTAVSTYAFDPLLEHRVGLAVQEGIAAAVGARPGAVPDARMPTPLGMLPAGDTSADRWRVWPIPRLQPISPVFEEVIRQTFVLSHSGFCSERLPPPDWKRLLDLHDPSHLHYLAARPDLMTLWTLSVVCWQKPRQESTPSRPAMVNESDYGRL